MLHARCLHTGGSDEQGSHPSSDMQMFTDVVISALSVC